jgi:hypothetical protein
MTAPRTAVHPSGARRRPTAAGTRRRKTPGTAARRPSGARKPNRRRVAGRRKARPARGRSLRDLRRLWPGLLIAVAVLTAVAWDTQAGKVPIATAECTLPGASLNLTAEQVTNARTIAQVARDRGLPDRAIVIALATAQQESRLRNLDYGDRDSLGLFQQRPSQGWGTEAEVQDPVYSAGKFYDGLVKVPNWETGRLTEIAQSVQLSGFPELYQQWEGMAQELTILLRATPDGAKVICG